MFTFEWFSPTTVMLAVVVCRAMRDLTLTLQAPSLALHVMQVTTPLSLVLRAIQLVDNAL